MLTEREARHWRVALELYFGIGLHGATAKLMDVDCQQADALHAAREFIEVGWPKGIP